ncbi:MAG: PilZ domain-containing protein [Acidobacteriota bacterium]|nr:PilZ domain-containing protein [Acidobacteriota bacterium]
MSTLNTVTERREKQRYDIQLPVHFRVSQKGAAARWSNGVTCDISSGGVSFRTRRPIPAGAHVELIIYWPAAHGDLYPVELQATGLVVRSTATRTAVAITAHRFRIDMTPAAPMGATA